ncbi:hypothetical protein BGZ99_000442, partial [Dissophora globulifera]
MTGPTKTPRLRWTRALLIALILSCIVLSLGRSTADAAAVAAADDVDLYSNDFSDSPGSRQGEDAPVHHLDKNVDEFSNYEAEDDTGVIDPSGHQGGIDLSTDETQSFFLSLAMIMVSEIGDKTFLIAAIMAMKHPRLLVFSAALSALAVMTVLSAAFGHAVPNLIPRTYTNYLAALLFFCFGIRMFFDGYYMTEEEEKHELEEVTQELQDKEDLELLQRAEAGSSSVANTDENAQDVSVLIGLESAPKPDAGSRKKESSGLINLFQLLLSPIFVQTFIMTFLAEWGDRSQIATIALAAAH